MKQSYSLCQFCNKPIEDDEDLCLKCDVLDSREATSTEMWLDSLIIDEDRFDGTLENLDGITIKLVD